MTTEEAISILDNGDWWDHMDEYIPRKTKQELIDALDIADTALREKQERENQKPLTLEELRQMDGGPVWISELEAGTGYWAIVKEVCDDKGVEGIFLTDVDDTDDYASFVLYGKTWLAYRHKQKEGSKC